MSHPISTQLRATGLGGLLEEAADLIDKLSDPQCGQKDAPAHRAIINLDLTQEAAVRTPSPAGLAYKSEQTGISVYGLAFDDATEEFYSGSFVMPPGSANAGIGVHLQWINESGRSGGCVTWKIQMSRLQTRVRNLRVGLSFPIALQKTCFHETFDPDFISSSSMLPSHTDWQEGDVIFYTLSRVAHHNDDSLNGDALLIGAQVELRS